MAFLEKMGRFEEYLRSEGKNPRKNLGYAEDSIPPRVSRVHRCFNWLWEHETVTTELLPNHADSIVKALDCDEFRQVDGTRFSDGSKRKLVDALVNWFEFTGTDWDPEIRFSDDAATGHADPFSREELRMLWQAALTYKSIPRYNNLSPEERDRWKGHIAQELGKPKSSVVPDDWDEINHSWKIPSLVRTTRAAGWRPAMVGRLKVSWYDATSKTVTIPRGRAIKNDASWDQELDDESAMALEHWLDQRANIERYDDREEIWLNREGNPYRSGSLNTLLRTLMDDAGIEPRGRTLVWYSFRHSIGTYVYDEYQDLELVAEVLRQKSRSSAARYVHPTAELKRAAATVV